MNRNFTVEKFLFLWLTPCLLLLGACRREAKDTLAIVGGKIIDVSHFGKAAADLENSVILIQGETITAVGKRGEVDIPRGARVITAAGKHIVPGLIDGFSALNNQAYANAHLYRGVTSVIILNEGGRGPIYESANPSPTIYKVFHVGTLVTTDDVILSQVEYLAKHGYKIALMFYRLNARQLRQAVAKAHSLGIATIAELGFCTYRDAISSGADIFIHTMRYSMDLAPAPMRFAVAKAPFGEELDGAKWRYFDFLSRIDTKDPRVQEHARMLGRSHIPLMPTLSLLSIDLPDNENPWLDPVARILSPADVNTPADRRTGKHVEEAERAAVHTRLVEKEIELEKLYYRAGATYLVGSATDMWGTLPGISLHTELKLLKRVGLSEREIIAAATANTAEAFGWKDVGQIKPGYRADLLVLAQDPLSDIERLKAIDVLIKGGAIIDRTKLLDLPTPPDIPRKTPTAPPRRRTPF